MIASGIVSGMFTTFRSRSTAKERDAESGLDYFGARYYGSALGRFTSPDPTGKYVISCGSGVKDCSKQTDAFNNAVTNGLNSKDPSVVSAAKAYGALGEKNGVNVSIVKVVDPNNKSVTGAVGALEGTGGIQSTADGKFMQATQVKIQAGLICRPVI